MRLNLYGIAHFLRDRFSWLWNVIEYCNGILFILRYGKRIKAIEIKSLPEGFDITAIKEVPTEKLVRFFESQPHGAFQYFHPHGFDLKSIKRLQKNKAFLGYVLIDKSNGNIAGYCFIRGFFHGQGFRGKIVDINYRGKGLGTVLTKLMNEVGFGVGLCIFTTISKDNVASYRSALSVSNMRVVKELPHNELYLEILPE